VLFQLFDRLYKGGSWDSAVEKFQNVSTDTSNKFNAVQKFSGWLSKNCDEFAHAHTLVEILNRKSCACANSRRNLLTTNARNIKLNLLSLFVTAKCRLR
jgi:hypothetical protein